MLEAIASRLKDIAIIRCWCDVCVYKMVDGGWCLRKDDDFLRSRASHPQEPKGLAGLSRAER